MKLYQNGDRCPCCGIILKGKTPEWLAEFSQLVDTLDELFLPPWPKPAEDWEAKAQKMTEIWEAKAQEQAPKREEAPAP